MKKGLKRHGSPDAITPDGLRSYRAALNELGNTEKQEVGCWTNNRVENCLLWFQRRERAMLRFQRMKSLQKFALEQIIIPLRQFDAVVVSQQVRAITFPPL
jgi:putative transposase